MRISEILRQLADVMDHQNPSVADSKYQNPAQMSMVNVNAVNNQDAGANDPVMIPPLQLKTELLKKSVGVNSVYDAGGSRADQTHHNQQQDMIIVLRKHAGIPTAAVMELSNNDVFDD
jgi:hypothetical protein